MKIYLQSLKLLNFKGIRSLDVTFQEITDIFGQNGKGKTTILDAWSWLMTGKDSANSTDFEIKTLGEDGEPFHKLSHEVSAVLLIDGQRNDIRKIYREKWTKKKGTAFEIHDGHTTEHFWNDVPLIEKEFKEKIATYISEPRFRLLTNLRYFNEVLKWQERRQGLLTLAGGIEDMDVAQQLNVGGKYDHLIKALTAKKTLDEYKKEIAGKIKKIKEDSENLPARIDEAKRGLTDEFDYEAIELRVAELNTELGEVETVLMDQTQLQKQRQEKITSLFKQKEDLSRQLITLENNARNTVRDNKQARVIRIADLKRELTTLLNERSAHTNAFNVRTREKESLQKERDYLIGQKAQVALQWDEEDRKVFKMDDSACHCPTCKQYLPNAAEISQDLENNFNKNKSDLLNSLTQKGKSINGEISEKEKAIALKQIEIDNAKADGETVYAQIVAKENEVATYEKENGRLSADENQQVINTIATSPEIKSVKEKIESLQQQIDLPEADDTKTELLSRKSQLSADIKILNNQLATKQQQEAINTRIAELERMEVESAQALADLEQFQFTLFEFDKAKMDMLEERINGKFQTIKFRLFDRQVNGGESATCVALINGVPYSDANYAAKVNANLDVVNVFANHFGISAPLFIDNRESVTVIIPTELQIINLIVSPADSRLRIGNAKQVKSELFN